MGCKSCGNPSVYTVIRPMVHGYIEFVPPVTARMRGERVCYPCRTMLKRASLCEPFGIHPQVRPHRR